MIFFLGVLVFLVFFLVFYKLVILFLVLFVAMILFLGALVFMVFFLMFFMVKIIFLNTFVFLVFFVIMVFFPQCSYIINPIRGALSSYDFFTMVYHQSYLWCFFKLRSSYHGFSCVFLFSSWHYVNSRSSFWTCLSYPSFFLGVLHVLVFLY